MVEVVRFNIGLVLGCRLGGESGGMRGAEVGAVAGEREVHCCRASWRSSATRCAVLASRPRVIATYADAAPVCSLRARWAVRVVSPWAP